ncbi:MAG: hypothetical protein HYV07_08500 [Deltaproteobacteria bacterium]|nr:hypothetical protein [Deltaproteobacteria bacterium]
MTNTISNPGAGSALPRPAATGPTKEELVQQVMREAPPTMISNAVDFWDAQSKEGGISGAIGHVMGGLLSFSGLPQLEQSAGELGARVGVGDSNANIARAAGRVAFDGAIVGLNAATGAGALAKLGRAGAPVAANVVRHYTTAAKAAKIMQSGEIWASRVGNAGVDKVYLLAEQGSKGGMNLLRRLNIGYGNAGQTAKAIEIDLSRVPPEVRARIMESAARGPLNLESFVTHTGNLNFSGFRDAVRVLDTEQLAVTMGQLGQAGGALARLGSLSVSTNRATTINP